MRVCAHTHTSWFNQRGYTAAALSTFGARRYCGDDCTGILMSSLYCVGLRWRESVDYLVTSPPFSPHLAPSELTTSACVCVCVCGFSLMKATGSTASFGIFTPKPQSDTVPAVSLRWVSLLSLAYVKKKKKSFEECLCCSHVSDCHRAAASVLVLNPDIKVTQWQRCSE